MTPQRKATLKDIAKLCGVSSMAVSMALSGKDGVSKKTAERITAAARKLNYSPNFIAKSLRSNETRTIGVVTSDSSHLLFAKMMKAIGEAADERDYSIIMANTGQNPEKEKKAVNTLITKRIDGLLLLAPMNVDEASLKDATDLGIPTAMLMRTGSAKIDAVISDNFRGGYEMADYLIKTGSKKLHMIALPKNMYNGSERLRGFKKALSDNGMRFNPRNVVYCEPYIESGYAAMKELLDRGLRNGAVMCGCDVIAIGAIRAIMQIGLKIPDDIRICGYDDIELLEDLRVALTTMRQPAEEMGVQGLNLLFKRIKNPQRPLERIVIPSELVIRGST